ncbi:MAG: PIN domain-containing protein [Bryobacteraceae bacterium]
MFRIASVDDAIVRRALDLKWRDFEDSVVAAAAESTGCDFIVTRDSAGFPNSPVKVVTPEIAAVLLRQSGPANE